ncbi:uncharacterized protein LOC116027022 [Ipomoea triloba]|uniref:uncharacterized protein LOC116027022 n=1 Tax=Ipomoea triloba TaxID=35885 RepID=UPI00125E0991|nr:uncharacterized protein LOC116027022 [Ipomoea triloba]
MKLDIAKAYDKMEWHFLEGMLAAMGFHQNWIQIVLMCVTTIRYNITVNGDSVGTVIPTRGIRQGDPLSPYLFIICAEGLSVLLQQAESRGDIHSIKVARGAPSILHLLFADDTLLFFKSSQRESQLVKDVLDLYCGASGQTIHYDKSNIMFSPSTPTEMRDSVATLLNVRISDNLGKYLGLPSFLGRNKSVTFRFLEQKLKERLDSWCYKFISRVGKDVLLKCVAQSLPIFTMSVYLLPKTTCDRIEKMMNRFWWESGGSDNRGIHWYFPSSSFLETQLGSNPSYIWRSILAGQSLLREGVMRRIGDGTDSLIWGWPWLMDPVNPGLNTPCIDSLAHAKVSGLFTEAGTWDEDVVRDLFVPSDVPRILATPVSSNARDIWCWKGDIRGIYTVRHGYRLLTSASIHADPRLHFTDWKKLWKLPVPPKVKNFLWHCMRNILPVREILQTHHVWAGGGCPFCSFHMESMDHLFGSCPMAAQVWHGSNIAVTDNLVMFINKALRRPSVKETVHVVANLWLLWNDTTVVDDNSRVTSWAPPSIHNFKCNVDAAVFEDGAGLGAIVRDHAGKFIAAYSARLGCGRDPYLPEAMAVKEALSWLNLPDFSYVGLIVKQCRCIANDIGNVSVHHVRSCVQQLPVAIYSTSMVDNDIEFYFLLNQETRFFPMKKHPPDVLFYVF